MIADLQAARAAIDQLQRDREAQAALIRQLQQRGSGVLTAPPVDPADGDTFVLQNAQMLTQGVRWAFQYNAAQARWEFIGGAPWLSRSTGVYVVTAPNTWEQMSNALFPRFTMPRGGSYRFGFGSRFATNAVAEGYFGVGLSSGVGPFDSMRLNAPANFIAHPAMETDAGGFVFTTGQVISGWHNTQVVAGSVGYQQQWMRILPVFIT